MNTNPILLLAIACVVTNPVAGDILVEDTNIELLEVSQIEPYTQLRVYQHPTTVNETNIWFSIDFGPSPDLVTLTFETINLDEGSDWYLAELDDVFSTQSIADGTHEIWGGVEHGGGGFIFGEIDVPIGEFYLGVNTDDCFCWPGERDIFGWAHFNVDADLNLQLIDNAVAYDTSQIIIGRNAISIPEPSGFFAACSMFVFIGSNRLRRS